MLHTTIKEVTENLPIESITMDELPKADYYALGHIHVDFEKEINSTPVIYGGPTFPNNFKELEELKYGKFYIVDVAGYTKITKKEIKIKEVEKVKIEITDSIKGTEKIIEELEKRDLKDKIVLLRIHGKLKSGKPSDIKFHEIQEYLEHQDVYSFLKNSSKLEVEKTEFKVNFESNEMEKVEEKLIENHKKENPSRFNEYLFPLLETLSLEKQEDEKSANFENRLLTELNKVLDLELI